MSITTSFKSFHQRTRLSLFQSSKFLECSCDMGVQDFWVVLFVIGFCFQPLVLRSHNLTCHPNDLYALLDFSSSLQSAIGGWGKNFSADCCKWAGSNQFDGEIPSNLPSCRHLNNINLARNNLSGQIPDSFKDFHTLNYLSLSNSSHYNLSSALQILQQCQNLTTLVLAMNFYDEELPADPTIHFAKLKVLIITNSRLTGSIPQWLSRSSRLQLLDISWNCLEGTIPAWLGNFTDLFFLDISNNSFNGYIPRSLTKLQSLITGNISFREPSPDFPLFMKKNASARGLQYNKVWSFPPTLDFSNNNLSGPIWPAFGNLKALHVLNLGFNSLSGPIPNYLSEVTNLETLDLSHNKLSGEIPPSLVRLSFLSKFSVAYNQLDGEIPTGGQFGTFPNSSFEGNNNICGDYASPCPSFSEPLPQPRPHSKSRVEYKGVVIGIAMGFVFGVACFIITDRYVWTWHF
ncbi:phytosulfokine receptor 1 isoform X4 [Rosa chinensis]|uniref:phytosulfokine receptor 1 isoform X4 n=1 Tax=Rosa chinensis TaxID=74649 RepID=UPI001AD8CE2D|nr:phytosulfokine receptor 1 isoform X4 [Rosa chinensis]